MAEEEPAERVVLRNIQKEQERERRRIRDRERRQSMTAEEREKHLARRRRNYQLRRQRAAAGAANPMIPIPSLEHQAAVIPIAVEHLQADDAASDALAKLHGKSRLNHMKQLARSFADTADAGIAESVVAVTGAGSVVKADEVPSGTCAQLKGLLRLNHVKRLARATNSQDHATERQVQQDPSGSEFHPRMPLIS